MNIAFGRKHLFANKVVSALLIASLLVSPVLGNHSYASDNPVSHTIGEQ